jgi:hypothetical protein
MVRKMCLAVCYPLKKKCKYNYEDFMFHSWFCSFNGTDSCTGQICPESQPCFREPTWDEFKILQRERLIQKIRFEIQKKNILTLDEWKVIEKQLKDSNLKSEGEK